MAKRSHPLAATLQTHCPAGHAQSVELKEGENALQCAECSSVFRALLVQVREKRSRVEGETRRKYSVRYLANEAEGFIEFIAWKFSDFEMKSRDTVALILDADWVYKIYNTTIDKDYENPRPSQKKAGGGCAPAILIATVVVVGLGLKHMASG